MSDKLNYLYKFKLNPISHNISEKKSTFILPIPFLVKNKKKGSAL